MLKILVIPREISCFPRHELGCEMLRDQWSGVASRKSHKRCKGSDKQPQAASLTVLREGNELKDWMLKQPVKTKSCSSIQILLRLKIVENKRKNLNF